MTLRPAQFFWVHATDSVAGQINLTNLALLTAGTLDIKPDDVPADAEEQPAAVPEPAAAPPSPRHPTPRNRSRKQSLAAGSAP